jgi:hypothetical protein
MQSTLVTCILHADRLNHCLSAFKTIKSALSIVMSVVQSTLHNFRDDVTSSKHRHPLREIRLFNNIATNNIAANHMCILADHSQPCGRIEHRLHTSPSEELIWTLCVSPLSQPHCSQEASFHFRGNTLRHTTWSRVLLDKLTKSFSVVYYIIVSVNLNRLFGLVVRVPGYKTEMYCASCEVQTEFMYVM